MGSIPAPVPQYEPNLHKRITVDALLSEAQLETVIYAGNAWQQYLDGIFTPSEEGVGLTLDEKWQTLPERLFPRRWNRSGEGEAGCCLHSRQLARRSPQGHMDF